MLIHLITDLIRKEDLRRRFDEDPERVIQEYDIPPQSRAALLARDTARLESQLHADASSLLMKLMPTAQFFWPGNQLQVKSIDPSSGQADTDISVTVKGELFATDATLTFKRPGSTVEGTDVKVTNSGLDSTMTAKARFTAPGVYDVTVRNPDTGQEATLSQGFTAITF